MQCTKNWRPKVDEVDELLFLLLQIKDSMESFFLLFSFFFLLFESDYIESHCSMKV